MLLLPACWTMDTRELGAQPTFNVLAVLWNTWDECAVWVKLELCMAGFRGLTLVAAWRK